MNRKLFLKHTAPAFTIIEILVVVSIIGLLVGLALPAIGGALNTAKKGKAKAEMQSIITALKAYQNEYGRMPDPVKLGGGGDGYFDGNASPGLFRMLAASTTDSSGENPRQIIFLELPPTSTNGSFADPFKQKKNYLVKIDTDGDNVVEYYGNKNGIAVVISLGSNGNQEDPTSKTSDDVYSFK